MIFTNFGTKYETWLTDFTDKNKLEEYKMKTINYKTAKEIRTAILIAIFSIAIFTTVWIKELQVNEKSSEINALVNQIEHEVPRRKRTDFAGLFSFRSKHRGISTVEITNKFIPMSPNWNAILFNEPELQIGNQINSNYYWFAFETTEG